MNNEWWEDEVFNIPGYKSPWVMFGGPFCWWTSVEIFSCLLLPCVDYFIVFFGPRQKQISVLNFIPNGFLTQKSSNWNISTFRVRIWIWSFLLNPKAAASVDVAYPVRIAYWELQFMLLYGIIIPVFVPLFLCCVDRSLLHGKQHS